MGHPQRQEQRHELLYGNGEPGTSKANPDTVLRLEDLLVDPFRFELADPLQD